MSLTRDTSLYEYHLQGGSAESGGMAPVVWQVLRKRDLPHCPGRQSILRGVRGQELHLRQFPFAPQVSERLKASLRSKYKKTDEIFIKIMMLRRPQK